MDERPFSGVGMLVATALLVAIMLALAFLAGPFGRTPTTRQLPGPYMPADKH